MCHQKKPKFENDKSFLDAPHLDNKIEKMKLKKKKKMIKKIMLL